MSDERRPAHVVGAAAALGSAALFGAGAPAAKALLGQADPWLLSGILYTASGVALFGYLLSRGRLRARLRRADLMPLAGAVILGGMVGPVLLMSGLSAMPASGASLLLNAESILTALVAWVVFRESTSRRIVLGYAAIAAGAVVLSAPGQARFADSGPALLVLGACLAWALDNNLTGSISHHDATWLAMVKGIVAGPVNLVLASTAGAAWPSVGVVLGASAVGVLAYGISLALFIVGMRHLGTARAGAYFSVAPFFGAVLALAAGEPLTWPLVVAGLLMAAGVVVHLTEHHEHPHTHEVLSHEHAHRHDDDHHDHLHPPGLVVTEAGHGRHVHAHTHAAVTHSHPHFPDAHHRHDH